MREKCKENLGDFETENFESEDFVKSERNVEFVKSGKRNSLEKGEEDRDRNETKLNKKITMVSLAGIIINI